MAPHETPSFAYPKTRILGNKPENPTKSQKKHLQPQPWILATGKPHLRWASHGRCFFSPRVVRCDARLVGEEFWNPKGLVSWRLGLGFQWSLKIIYMFCLVMSVFKCLSWCERSFPFFCEWNVVLQGLCPSFLSDLRGFLLLFVALGPGSRKPANCRNCRGILGFATWQRQHARLMKLEPTGAEMAMAMRNWKYLLFFGCFKSSISEK